MSAHTTFFDRLPDGWQDVVEGLVDGALMAIAEAVAARLGIDTPAGPGQGGGNDVGNGAEPSSGATTVHPPRDQAPPAPARPQDAVVHTCELCGRAGTRRYTPSATGWQCNDRAACARRRGNLAQPDAPPPMPDNREIPPPPTDPTPPPAPKPPVAPGGITARCLDCTRTWTLPDKILVENAAYQHEQKHSHIVQVML